MNILLTSDGYPTSDYPTNGIFAFDQAKALKKYGHDVIMAVVDVRSLRRKRSWGYKMLVKEGIKIYVYSFPLGRVPIILLDLFRIYLYRYLYRKILNKEEKTDIVHAHFGLSAGYPTAKLCEQYSLPLIVTEHGSNVHVEKISSYTHKKLRFTYSRAKKVLAVSNSLAERIFELTSVKAQIIPNILDVSCFAGNVKKNHDSFNIISVGNLVKGKGMDILIAAFIAAFGDDCRVKLFICGDGPKRNDLKKIIEKSDVQERIHLLGMMTRKEIAELMQICDCFALASYSETFGVAYIEALAAGIPVVATSCGGPEDFMTNETGILVPVADVNAFSCALKNIKCNYQYFIPTKISGYIVSKYSPLIIAEEIDKVYHEVLSN